MSVLQKRIDDLQSNIDKLKELQAIEKWAVDHVGEIKDINNFHSWYSATIKLPDIDSMTDAIDNVLTHNPVQMYKIKDGSFTSFRPMIDAPEEGNAFKVHPVICDVNPYEEPKIKFAIDSPFGLILVERKVTNSGIKIEYDAYSRPTKYRHVKVIGYENWFNSFIKYSSGNNIAINPFTLYNEEN